MEQHVDVGARARARGRASAAIRLARLAAVLLVGCVAAPAARAAEPLLGDLLVRDAEGRCRARGSALGLLERLDDARLEDLANPELSTRAEIEARGCECTAIESALALERVLAELRDSERGGGTEGMVSLLARSQIALALARQFLRIALPWHDAGLYLVGDTLALVLPVDLPARERRFVLEAADRAYRRQARVWKRLGLPAPRGRVYVRVYARREAVQQAWKLSDKVAGVTLACRFVALSSEFGRAEFGQVLEHELSHVALNSAGGYARALTLPRWLEEGFAVFASGDPGRRVVSVKMVPQPGGGVISTGQVSVTDEEYMRFKGAIEFIVGRAGLDGLARVLRVALTTGDAGRALRDVLGLADEAALLAVAGPWIERRNEWRGTLAFVVLVDLLAAIFVFGWWGTQAGIAWLALGALACLAASWSEYFRGLPLSALGACVLVLLGLWSARARLARRRRDAVAALLEAAEFALDEAERDADVRQFAAQHVQHARWRIEQGRQVLNREPQAAIQAAHEAQQAAVSAAGVARDNRSRARAESETHLQRLRARVNGDGGWLHELLMPLLDAAARQITGGAYLEASVALSRADAVLLAAALGALRAPSSAGDDAPSGPDGHARTHGAGNGSDGTPD